MYKININIYTYTISDCVLICFLAVPKIVATSTYIGTIKKFCCSSNYTIASHKLVGSRNSKCVYLYVFYSALLVDGTMAYIITNQKA